MISTSDENGTITISVSGNFDFSSHRDFIDAYKQYEKHQKRFVVDLNKAEYMDSSALGMLLQLKEYSKGGDSVVISNPNDDVTKILQIAKFDQLFKIR
jgi:anti-anti-sigma factor